LMKGPYRNGELCIITLAFVGHLYHG
jgi:hypothetical protein